MWNQSINNKVIVLRSPFSVHEPPILTLRNCILSTNYISIFNTILGINIDFSPNGIKWLVFAVKMLYLLYERGNKF
jgi:hypothetical protein